MSRNLFSEFSPSHKTIWQNQAEKESKGPVTGTNFGLNIGLKKIEPYYTRPEMDAKRVGQMQNSQKRTTGWLNMPSIKLQSGFSANKKIKETISGGADAILLNVLNERADELDFSKLLHGFRLSETPFFFETNQNPLLFFEHLTKAVPYHIKGGIAFDPIANQMRNGKSFEFYLPLLTSLFSETEIMQDFYPLMVESHVFHESGANPVQELAFLLGTFVTYIDFLTDAGIHPEKVINSMFLSVSVGTDYLTEIAKLRALRFLHKKVSFAYGLSQPRAAFIHVKTSSFYNSESVPYTNMLRSSSEAMSAIIGGCDAVTVQAYNHTFEKTNEFSERMARNTSLVIENETYLSHVADPSAGSYFIENLSIQTADAAWNLFLKTEEQGGMVQSFEKGFIQDEIEKSLTKKLEGMQNERIMVGVNKYNPDNVYASLQSDSTTQDVYSGTLRLLPKINLAKLWNKQTASHETGL